MNPMPLDLSELQAQVERDATVNASAITLLSELATRLEAAKGDPVAIQALADALRANQDALAGAVTTNTPAAPA
jgi:hypothetical protein